MNKFLILNFQFLNNPIYWIFIENCELEIENSMLLHGIYGGYRLAAKTSVCGTENLGSIPSTRPCIDFSCLFLRRAKHASDLLHSLPMQ